MNRPNVLGVERLGISQHDDKLILSARCVLCHRGETAAIAAKPAYDFRDMIAIASIAATIASTPCGCGQ
jgi:hypothetical protein